MCYWWWTQEMTAYTETWRENICSRFVLEPDLNMAMCLSHMRHHATLRTAIHCYRFICFLCQYIYLSSAESPLRLFRNNLHAVSSVDQNVDLHWSGLKMVNNTATSVRVYCHRNGRIYAEVTELVSIIGSILPRIDCFWDEKLYRSYLCCHCSAWPYG